MKVLVFKYLILDTWEVNYMLSKKFSLSDELSIIFNDNL